MNATLKAICEMTNIYKPRERSIWAKERFELIWLQMLASIDDAEWIESFRVTKDLFEYICSELESELKPLLNPLTKREPVSVEKQVGLCLYRLASSCEYRVVGKIFGLHTSTVQKHFYRVINAINKKLLRKVIYMPKENEALDISKRFQKITGGIPQIIGCIDGTHIPILPPEEGMKDFINRKSWASIILQAIVDDRCLFRNISCKFPGSAHDANVFKNSAIFERIEEIWPKETISLSNVDIPYIILGDPAYPLLPWLLKNYPGSGLTAEKQAFNEHMNSGRIRVEMSFGKLKCRFRILCKRSEVSYKFMPKVVAACCVLHNLIELNNKCNTIPQKWIKDANLWEGVFQQPDIQVSRERNDFTAVNIRNTLCEFLNLRE